MRVLKNERQLGFTFILNFHSISQEKEQMKHHYRNIFKDGEERNPCLQVVEQWLATNEFNYSKQLTA